MPPKGWRKNGESSQLPKEAELVSIDDILFPRSTIQKLAKSILNTSENSSSDAMGLTKDSLIAVQRSATVFVSHLMFHARQIARDSGRKNVNSQDILHALERADLAGFSPEIKQKLSTFESDVDAKKKQKADAKESGENGAASTEEPAAKKLRNNSSKTVSKTGNEEENDDEIDDDDDTENIDEETEDAKDDEATVSPANEGTGEAEEEEDDDEEERVAANPIALLGQEEEELGGLEPKESDKEDQDSDEE
ncbi:hypothetical protein JCM33374_g4849 [Metschnikowia sp. JCM 33374]|nr:hypothetical protein JCM33374_g4849 [Metschnikowia sp. JCM 33374]